MTSCRKAALSAESAPAPFEVSVVRVTEELVPVIAELPGRVVSPRVAQVRARVTGILQKQHFVEGSDVKVGDLLFSIEPAPLEAALASARATLAKAEASLHQLEATAKRTAELVKIEAVSQETHDTAAAALAAQNAAILEAQAAVQTAELNLSYTRVLAPISGRIGRALVTEGALVTATSGTDLTIIRQVDEVFVDFTQSSAEYLRLQRAALERNNEPGRLVDLRVSLILEDGSAYSQEGLLQSTESAVDESTGMVILRASFPNTARLLIPGAFVRVRLTEPVSAPSLTVPQRAVTRNSDGSGTVYVVAPCDRITTRRIVTTRAVGDRWVVADGLKAGETIVAEGLQKVREGAAVRTVPLIPTAPSGTPDKKSTEG